MPFNPVGVVGGVPSTCSGVNVVVAEPFPAVSLPEYATLWVALSPVTAKVADAPAAFTVAPPSTERVIVPAAMPLPASVPLTVTLSVPYQVVLLQAAPLQSIDTTGATRSEIPFCDALLALVKKPVPCASLVWIV
jgi:hypothetical protein